MSQVHFYITLDQRNINYLSTKYADEIVFKLLAPKLKLEIIELVTTYMYFTSNRDVDTY